MLWEPKPQASVSTEFLAKRLRVSKLSRVSITLYTIAQVILAF